MNGPARELSPLVDLQIVWSVANVVHAWLRGELNHDWQPLPNALLAHAPHGLDVRRMVRVALLN